MAISGKLAARLLTAAVLFGVAPACTARPSPVHATVRRPNVIMFVTDDQTIGTWRAMPRTFEQIVQKGVVFRHAYVSDPVCCPSRTTILTGGYAHTTGVYSNGGRYGGFHAFHRNGLEHRTIASYLDPTYETALFGKYLNHYASAAEHLKPGYVPQGWDEWQAFYENNGRYDDYRLNVDGDIVSYGHRPSDFSTDVIGRRLRDWLDPTDGDGRDPSQPFFAYVAPAAPHGLELASRRHGDDERFANLPAYRSPAVDEADVLDKPEYIQHLPRLGREGQQQVHLRWIRQFQSLYSFDRQVGMTLNTLRAQHLLSNTVVVFTSDNGQTTGEHRWRYKLVPYERSIRVPLAIRYDPIDNGGSVDRRDLVMNADLFATVMDLTLGPAWVAPTPVDGVSLRRAIAGEQTVPLRHSILLENLYYVRNGQPSVPTYCGILTLRWKYIVYSPTAADPALVSGTEDHELYDLVRDPFELHNLASERPPVEARLRSLLSRLCVPAPPGWTVAL